MPDSAGNRDQAVVQPGKAGIGRSCFGRLLYLVGFVFIAVMVAAAALAIWGLRRDRIADATQETKNLAVVLAAQTARSFQAIDWVLRETQGMVQAAGIADPEQFRQRMATEDIHRFLVDRLHTLPQADAISLIDDAGRIVNFSRTWPAPIIDTADRDFYAYWHDHDDSRVFIGAPVVNKVTGAWVLTIMEGVPSTKRLSELGIARVSYGAIPYVCAMKALGLDARQVLT
jgi:hypothetical protein